MSWSSTFPRSRARIGRAAFLAMMLFGLGGCLQPMYTTVGGNLGAELRAVAVDPVPERLGYYLHDQLVTNLNGTGARVDPKYRLVVTPHERVQSALVDITTQRPQNGNVVTDVDYKLFPIGSDAPIATGTVTSSAAYDRSEQRFANIRASQDAEKRDAKTVADQITTRVAAAIASPQPGATQ